MDSELADVIIPSMTLGVILIFIIVFFIILFISKFQPSPRINSNFQLSDSNLTCRPGQCLTDLQSGIKTCPDSDSVSLVYNPNREVCNDRFRCDNKITPFALNSDGSTNIYGVCEDSVECPCLRSAQCPNYIQSVFTTKNGNPYQNLNFQRITFPQESDIPPIKIDPTNTFCMVPLAWISISTPGCNFTNSTNSMNYDELINCMGGASKCEGFYGNPCKQGTLAFITDDVNSINPNNINQNLVGCVSGDPCPCGTIQIFDTNYGGIICREI